MITGPPSLELYNKAKDHLSEVLMWYKTLPPSCVRLGNNSLLIQKWISQIYKIVYSETNSRKLLILHTASINLVFHDCVGSDGCDGCLNLNNPDNHGFEAVVEFLAYDRDMNFPVLTAEET